MERRKKAKMQDITQGTNEQWSILKNSNMIAHTGKQAGDKGSSYFRTEDCECMERTSVNVI